jgi:uncharacterized protein YerC
MALISKSGLIELQKILGTDVPIAKKLKVNHQTIFYYRKKYGIPSFLAGIPKRNAKIIAMYKAGKTAEKIALNVGLSVAQIYRVTSGQRSKKK